MPRTTPPRKDKNNVPRLKRELPAAPKKEAERIAKVVARAGLASRREIEEWIAQGRVAVNGTVLESPAVTVTASDTITVDGAPLPEKERTRLFLYHKPRGVVTTNRDPEGRATLFEILPRGLPRLVSVGRLDLNSEGLLLLTNDGGLARVLELPETGWLRRYRVRANGEVDQAKLDTLIKGITVDGVEYGPIEAELDRVQGANAWITVSLREGKNREVRNVLGALGLKVNRLIRISYGPFQLGEIPEAGIEEVRTRVLRDQIGSELAAAAGADFDAPLVEREIEDAPPRLPPRAPAAARPRGAAPAQESAPQEFHDEVRDEFRAAGPRTRRRIAEVGELEKRGTVADRKGRAVQVERLSVKPKDAERPARAGTRSAAGKPGMGKAGMGRTGMGRRGTFEEGDARPPRGGRFEREDRGGDERPARPFRPRDGEGRDGERRSRFNEGEGRPPRGRGGFGGQDDRKFGAERPARPFRPRDGEGRDGERRSRFNEGEGRPPRGRGGFGGQDERKFGAERPARPFRPRDGEGRDGERREGARPRRFEKEGSGERGFRSGPPGEKRFGRGRDAGGERHEGARGKPYASQERGNRSLSESPFAGDRPQRAGPAKPYAKGPKGGPKGAGRPGAGFGGRPSGTPKGNRPGGKGGPRPGGSRPGGPRPGGPRGKR